MTQLLIEQLGREPSYLSGLAQLIQNLAHTVSTAQVGHLPSLLPQAGAGACSQTVAIVRSLFRTPGLGTAN